MTPYTACLDHTNVRTKLMHQRSAVGDAFVARVQDVNVSAPARQIAQFEWLLAEVNPIALTLDAADWTEHLEHVVEDELDRLEKRGWKGRRE